MVSGAGRPVVQVCLSAGQPFIPINVLRVVVKSRPARLGAGWPVIPVNVLRVVKSRPARLGAG